MRKFTRRAFLAGAGVLASLLVPLRGLAHHKPWHNPKPSPSPSPPPTLMGLYTADYQALY